jgi:hypothetical protein
MNRAHEALNPWRTLEMLRILQVVKAMEHVKRTTF